MHLLARIGGGWSRLRRQRHLREGQPKKRR
jgi:hypothetical protein